MNVDDVLKCWAAGNLGAAGAKSPELPLYPAFSGRTVLVTGAGGSIGSALCRAIARMPVKALVMVDRDDSALHALQLSLGDGGGPALTYHLRDICLAEDLAALFRAERPEIVLHAAALKHVPLLEDHPAEGYRVNVSGTVSALSAAAESGAEVFVNVSTDKASNPRTVLGLTKRLGERLTSHFGDAPGRRYVSVRLGNVVGSRGSFLPTFAAQIESGRPISITHADVTRFLMTFDGAVELILRAAEHGRSGETLIADMGSPVRILDIANSMIDLAGTRLPIEIIGLRPGDKLHEDYLDDTEVPLRDPQLPGFVRVKVEGVDPDVVRLEHFLRSIASESSPIS